MKTIFDSQVFDGKSEQTLKIIIGKYTRGKYGSYEHMFKGNKCYFSDNYSKVKLVVVVDGISYLDYKNSPYFCGTTGCKCRTLNPVSLEFLTTCAGLSVDDAKLKLTNKGQKAFNSAFNDPNTKHCGVLAKRGINSMSKAELFKLFNDEALVQEYLSNKGTKGKATQRANGWFDDISNNPFSKLYWVGKGHTEEESQAIVNSRNFWCKEFKDTHPESMFENPSKLDYWFNKYGVEEGTRRYNENIARSVYSSSLDGLIEKYGAVEGELIYKRRLMSSTEYFGTSSREANKFFIKLYRKLRRLGYLRSDMMFGVNGSKEFCLMDETVLNGELYDFCLLPLNIIIEYNGALWHPRKDRLSDEKYETWRMPFHPTTTAEQKEQKDRLKNNFAIERGYNLFEIWDYQSTEEKLTICLERIYEARNKENSTNQI